MSSVKCPQCGLVNFADAQVCKRCGSELTVDSAVPSASSVDRLASSLVNCPDCGRGCSTFAEHCPQCGRVFRKADQSNARNIRRNRLIAITTLILAFGVGSLLLIRLALRLREE